MQENLNFIFFGGEPLAVPTLEKLYNKGLVPKVIICNPDKPSGRNLEITPPPTKVWAMGHKVPYLQPEKLDAVFVEELKSLNCELGVVVAYGKIIPKEIVDMYPLGLINIHPSLLPLYRGPSPIVAAILNGDTETGVSIIKIDEEMDHGPMLAQEKITLTGNETVDELENILAEVGGELLAKVLPEYISGKIIPKEQNHAEATFVKKIVKEDGEINLNDDAQKNYNKYRAYFNWPRTFFFKDGKRIIITKARLENGKFVIEKVIPEGGKEQDYKTSI
jgi:methionyl-tRNA formyltransferase